MENEYNKKDLKTKEDYKRYKMYLHEIEKLGVSKQSIKTCMYLFRCGKTKKCRYVKVEVDDD